MATPKDKRSPKLDSVPLEQEQTACPGRLVNLDELEIDDVIRIMGETPPPPKRQDAKKKRKG
jgi:hypothetical protein